MRTIWQSLIWKEWHEHKWKLASLTAILWSIATLGLINPERGLLAGIHVALVMAIVPLAIFIGLGVAAGERSRGTLPFLQALPVPMWRVALFKLAAGLATVLLPALLCIAFVFAWTQLGSLLSVDYRHMMRDVVASSFEENAPFVLVNHWYANAMLALTIVASGFFLWTAAAGVNRKDEVSAGAVALTVIMAWCVAVFSVWAWLGNGVVSFTEWPSAVGKLLALAGAAAAPGGLVTLEDAVDNNMRYFAFAVCVTCLTMVILAAWYVCRFARSWNMENRSPQAAEVSDCPRDWLGPPRRWAVSAIAWKQVRESGPLALLGVGVVFALSATIFLVDDPGYRHDDFSRFLEFFAVLSFSIGLAVAMIIGIGVFLYDVGTGLSAFWRSRPINPDVWFLVKFGSGLAIVLAAIYGPVVLLALPRSTAMNLEENSLLVYPAITVAVFAAAAAMTCLARNAVYAAILSVSVAYLGFIATAFAVAGVRILQIRTRPDNLGDVFAEVTMLQASAGMFMTFLLCTLLAWLAVRNDWGQKSRY